MEFREAKAVDLRPKYITEIWDPSDHLTREILPESRGTSVFRIFVGGMG